MTIGIYKLVFNGTTSVYIGQSLNIERRFSQHKYGLKSGTHSKKLMRAYSLYGLPSLEILSECGKKELNTQELECIEVYNSIQEGFNEHPNTAGGGCLYGNDNSRSLYSEDTVLLVVLTLVNNPELTQRQVSETLQVGLSFVEHVSAGNTGRYIQNTYPLEYSKLMSLKGNRYTKDKISNSSSAKARGIVYPKIVSPEGVSYSVDNIRKFGRDHNLNNGDLCQVLNKRKATIKGWKLEE